MRRKIVEFRDVASLFTIPRDRGSDAERPSTSILDRVLDAALIITAALVAVLVVAMACTICL